MGVFSGLGTVLGMGFGHIAVGKTQSWESMATRDGFWKS